MRTCGWLASEPSSGDTRSSQFVPSPDGLSLVPACSLVKVRIESSSSVDFLEGARRRESKIPRVLHAGRKGARKHLPSSGASICTGCY